VATAATNVDYVYRLSFNLTGYDTWAPSNLPASGPDSEGGHQDQRHEHGQKIRRFRPSHRNRGIPLLSGADLWRG
jgi:hypothetical protein